MKTTSWGILIFVAFFASIHAEAAKIVSIKNGKALLDLEGEASPAGSLWLARDASGKKKAILEVSQTKQGRAIAVVKKGNLQPGYSLERMPQAGSNAAASADGSTSGSGGNTAGADKTRIGFLGGYSMNSMTAKPASGSIALTGSSFNLVGFYQMQLDTKIFVKLLAGYETLSASNETYNVDLGYLGFTAQIEYKFYQGQNWDFWGGGGLGFLYAINKSSNILDTAKISINQTVVAVIGTDYRLSKTTFIPLQLSYQIFPDNASSSATQIIFRGGWGRDF
jgi:hypothetical protein